VWFVVQRGDKNQLSYFNQQFNIQPSYPILVDPEDGVASLYALIANPTTIIIDKTGVVRYVGGFAPWTKIAEEIEAINGKLVDVDLSSTESAVKALKSPESYIRWKAAKALGDMGDQTVVPELIASLKDESASVREISAQALGDIGDKEAVEPLISAFDDKSDLARAEIVNTLSKLKDERAITPLVKSLINANLREDTAIALAKMNKPELVSKALEENSSVLKRGQPSDVSEVYASLGLAYQKIRMYDAAIPLFSKAVDAATESYRKRDFTGSLATCYIEMGETEKAAAEYLRTIKSASIDRISLWSTGADGTMEGFDEREWAIQGFVESYQQRNKLDDLAKILEAKVAESPQDVILYEASGYVYNAQGMSQKAIPMYEKAVELNPNYVKDYVRLILAYNHAGMADKAIATAKEMSKKPSGDISNQSSMAKAYLECKMYNEAIAAYKKAIAVAQGDWDRKGYMFGLANSYVSAGKHAEAIAEYEDIIKISAGDIYYRDMAERLLWDVYAKGNMYGTAIEKYQKIAEANPKDANAHEYLAKAYQGKGQIDNAIAEYEQIIKISPYDAKTYNILGDIYKAQGDTEKTIYYYKKAVMLDPANSALREKLGDSYRDKGMQDEAIAEYEQSQAQALASIEGDSKDPWVYNNLAWFYVQKKIKPKEAVSLAEKAIKMSPNNGAILDTLGWAYMRDDRFDDALQIFSELFAIELFSVSGWNAVSEIVRSSVKPEAFLKFYDDMNKLSASITDSQMRADFQSRIDTKLASFYEYHGEKEKASQIWAKMGIVKDTDELTVGTLKFYIHGDAYRDINNEYFVLTRPERGQAGRIFTVTPYEMRDWIAEFEIRLWGGKGIYGGADGMTFAFIQDYKYPSISGGGLDLGGKGYAVEFDTFIGDNDPKGQHIGLLKDNVNKHLTTIMMPDGFNDKWHNVKVAFTNGQITVYYDDKEVISNFAIPNYETFTGYFGFTAATGADYEWHAVRNIRIAKSQ